jgi:phosphate uptake regulator
MKRKIIKQGHNTLTLTLPSEWVKKFNLAPGSEVDVNERDNGLFISTEKNNSHRKAEFDITEMDIPTIWKYFMAVYREGYDEVLIKFKVGHTLESPYKFLTQHRLDIKYGKKAEKSTVLEFLHDLVNRFVGFEIVEHGKDFVLIKDMSEPTSREFENALRRVFLLINQMSDEICEVLRTKNTKMLGHIHDVDVNLDKFHDYCIRILNKIGNKDCKKTSLLFANLYLLELLGDEFKNISCHLIADYPKSDFKNILEVSESINKQINLYYSLFYNFDLKKVIEMSDIDMSRYFSVTKVSKKTRKEDEEIFHHLRIVTRYLNALTELRIEMEF